MKEIISLLRLFYDFLDQLNENEIADLLSKKAKLKIEVVNTEKKAKEYNTDEMIAILDSFESRCDAEKYIGSIHPNLDLLRQLAKHYSIPNASKMKLQDITNKIIEATAGTKERHKALYETNV